MSKRPTKRPGRPSKQPPKRFRDEEAEGEDEMGVKESLTQLLAEQKALRKEIAEIRAAKTPAPEASPAGSTTSTGGKSNSGMAGHSGHSDDEVPAIVSTCRATSGWDFTSARTIGGDRRLGELLTASYAKGTQQAYRRTWVSVTSFLKQRGFSTSLPMSTAAVCLYIGSLHEEGKAASTVMSAVSAISCVHKLNGLGDPTIDYTVKRLLQGCKRVGDKGKDTRLPITVPILNSIMEKSEVAIGENYEKIRFRAMCTLAFHSLLRVGEMAVSREPENVLHRGDVRLDGQALTITFRNFKSSAKPVTHTVEKAKAGVPGAVEAMRAYMSIRGNATGPLFRAMSGAPITAREFNEQLQLVFQFCGLPKQNFKSHSFRIGGASHMARNGASDAQIRQAGRWSSNAFLSYIRVHNW
ncbi:uncharacterized protein [Littorina saxatilis]|uniref:uncharacterized protein n=1 Tax=Littorina saxatilis TaxID=31220 RepID=UPI0038B49FA2